MELLDFDKRFSAYTEEWVRQSAGKYASLAQMEEQMPELYIKWLNLPAKWLNGRTPGNYFTQWTDPSELITMLLEYIKQRVSLPDPLLEAISALGEPSASALIALLESNAPAEAQMLAVSLLAEIDGPQPIELYIKAILGDGRPVEVRERMAEALGNMGPVVLKPCLNALSTASDEAAEFFLSVLSDYPGYDEVIYKLIELFEKRPERQALFASYLAKCGDARALPSLEKAAAETRSYVAYLEIRNAVEALGGEDVPEREFAGDPDYQAVYRLVEEK